MNCIKCKRSISLSEEVQFCPYCGEELCIGVIDEKSSMFSILEYIVSLKGKGIYNSSSIQQLVALLTDLSVHNRDKLKLYILAINMGICNSLFLSDGMSDSDKSLCLANQIRTFEDEYYIKSDVADEVVRTLALGLGWKNVFHKSFTHRVKGVLIGMVAIKGGTFIMGSPENELGRDVNETQHEVTLSDFYIGKYEVTQRQWEAVMGSNNNPSYFKGDNLPVECVSWDEVQGFIKKLNHLTIKKYRLPTEAEWEYACRAGAITPFNIGDNLITYQANYNGNHPYNDYRGRYKGIYKETTMRIGSFAPNAWGIYDMHGNVSEWCNDWYGDYPTSQQKDPTGPSSGYSRVYRGGSWSSNAQYCRSAYRNRGYPYNRNYDLGFRLALSL